jgi:Domain of unknown function (DUF4406)
MKKIVYVAGPYTSGHKKLVRINIERAEEYGKQVLLAGYFPFIPHKNTSFWGDDDRFFDRTSKDWIDDVCLPFLSHCDILFLIPGWESSRGSIIEKEFAEKYKIPIIYSIEELKSYEL